MEYRNWKTQRKKYRFCKCIGSPMATNITHQFASVGTDHFIQTGYFGDYHLM